MHLVANSSCFNFFLQTLLTDPRVRVYCASRMNKGPSRAMDGEKMGVVNTERAFFTSCPFFFGRALQT